MDQDGMLVEKYMEQVTHIMDQIESRKLQLESISAQAYSLSSSCNYQNSRVQISFDTEAAFARMLEKAEACAERLEKELELSLALKQQAIDLINRYTVGRENYILTARYLNNLSWPQISAGLVEGHKHLSPKQLRRVCRAALAKIVLPEDAIWIPQNSHQGFPHNKNTTRTGANP
jgi:hypothetical protein